MIIDWTEVEFELPSPSDRGKLVYVIDKGCDISMGMLALDKGEWIVHLNDGEQPLSSFLGYSFAKVNRNNG